MPTHHRFWDDEQKWFLPPDHSFRSETQNTLSKGGVFDQIRYRGFSRRLYEFHSGQAANDPSMHFNLRSQVRCEMPDRLKTAPRYLMIPSWQPTFVEWNTVSAPKGRFSWKRRKT